MRWELIIGPEDAGKSAGDILQQRFHLSRLLCKRVRLYGTVTVDGIPHRMKDPCAEGQHLFASYVDPLGECQEWIPSTALIPVLAQTEHWVIVSKPPRMVTHPTYLHQENCLTQRLSSSLLRPVSRLDRDTSGVVLLAKSGYAHHTLAQTKMDKTYLAFVHGLHCPEQGEIQAPIRRASDSILLREVHPDGRPSASRYQVRKRWPCAQVTLLEYQLLTGRTHQLRLHSLHAGWPLLGETLYGCGRYDPNWSLHRRYSILPDREERTYQATQSSFEGENCQTFPFLQEPCAYLGTYRNSKARFGDLRAQKPEALDLKQALYWDTVLERQALHAHQLKFMDPWTQKPICIEAPLPTDLQQLVQKLDQYEENQSEHKPHARN